jgi:hypothetical protein
MPTKGCNRAPVSGHMLFLALHVSGATLGRSHAVQKLACAVASATSSSCNFCHQLKATWQLSRRVIDRVHRSSMAPSVMFAGVRATYTRILLSRVKRA